MSITNYTCLLQSPFKGFHVAVDHPNVLQEGGKE